jgi:hypothetical protein
MAKTKVDNAIFPSYYYWLEACAPGGGLAKAWGLGCRICRLRYNPNGKNEHGGPWAQLGVRNTSIQKCSHTKIPKRSSPKRASNVLHMIAGCDHNSVVQAAIIAPPLEHFIALLRRLKESHSKLGRLGRKGNTMAWCLFEALRDDECKFLATEDSRAGGLLTKWVACGGLDRCGLALQLATRKGLRTFATCRRGGKTAASGPT